ncbi:MAG: hypothetical protein ACLFM5_01280 [Spirochaetaceae bacterium]
MRRIWIVAALAFWAGAVATAETIMVSVHDQADSGDEDYVEASRFHLSAAEDGVMSVLFEEGHIVFNLGEYGVFDGPEIARRYMVREAARDGGARYIVDMMLEFERIEGDRLEPAGVNYELREVDGGPPVASGRMTGPFGEDEASERGERSAALGRRVGEELLSAW